MNTPITYELAKLLKEKDFNLKVVNYYNYEKLSLISDKDRRIGGLVNYNPINWNAVKEHYTSAPTIAEMLMWLYEKHGVWIEVNLPLYCSFKYTILTTKSFAGTLLETMSDNEFEEPTEAYLAAIEYTLKNIIK